ncbi:RWD domain-containing protein 4 [Arctopsyche grandis]|uniref:RWD domain-containing protein 4 n=1 Tax=Arctopsyche grandis TaxID=121162 RepID=UPI00406D8DD4
MTDAELQLEEREVLSSIYDGDEAFKQISPSVYQYKYGENENIKSFLIELSWGPNYPTEKPLINMDTFYNRNLIQSVKDKIVATAEEEANQWLGCAMTYTIFECLKEKFNELLEDQTDSVAAITTDVEKISVDAQEDSKKQPKKEQLTKSQKRRAWDRAESGKGGEKPRGWDWVDIVKHLSQVPHNNASQNALTTS